MANRSGMMLDCVAMQLVFTAPRFHANPANRALPLAHAEALVAMATLA